MRASELRYNARTEVLTGLLPAFTANGTKNFIVATVPQHPRTSDVDRFRIVRVSVASLVVPVDADGTMLLNLFVRDKTEGANDTIVSSADMEAITQFVNNGLTLAAETSENERTIAGGDTIHGSLVNNSAAIDTNWALHDAAITVELLRLNVNGENFGQDL